MQAESLYKHKAVINHVLSNEWGVNPQMFEDFDGASIITSFHRLHHNLDAMILLGSLPNLIVLLYYQNLSWVSIECQPKNHCGCQLKIKWIEFRVGKNHNNAQEVDFLLQKVLVLDIENFISKYSRTKNSIGWFFDHYKKECCIEFTMASAMILAKNAVCFYKLQKIYNLIFSVRVLGIFRNKENNSKLNEPK